MINGRSLSLSLKAEIIFSLAQGSSKIQKGF